MLLINLHKMKISIPSSDVSEIDYVGNQVLKFQFRVHIDFFRVDSVWNQVFMDFEGKTGKRTIKS